METVLVLLRVSAAAAAAGAVAGGLLVFAVVGVDDVVAGRGWSSVVGRWVVRVVCVATGAAVGLVGLVGHVLAWAVVLASSSGWVWVPAGLLHAWLLVVHVALALRWRRLGVEELARPAWRARWDDARRLRQWFTVHVPLRAPLALWAVLPGAYLVFLYFGRVLRAGPRGLADGDPSEENALLAVTGVGGVLVLVALTAVARADPAVVLTRAVLAPHARRWHLADLGRRMHLTPMATVVTASLRRRRRRLAIGHARRYAEAAGCLDQVLRLAEGAGYSDITPRITYREAQRIALRCAVGADPGAALVVFDDWVRRRGLEELVHAADRPSLVTRVRDGIEGLTQSVRNVLFVVLTVLGLVWTVANGASFAQVVQQFR